jgi:hypothetical protein
MKDENKHHDEMLFLRENQKRMKPGEARRYWSAVRKSLEIDIKMHELYVLVKDRVDRYGK